MIYYYNQIIDKDITLSIDNIILDVSLTKPEIRDLFSANISAMANGGVIEVRSWESFKSGTFRRQMQFVIDANRAFWLGQGLIGKGVLEDRYRLDFNPNKVAKDLNFQIIREFLVRNSRTSMRRITRFDLAIDIPVERSQCFLVKDRRLYIERKHGQEYTQYLGAKSSTVGRVKLYNKTAEAKLDYPLTRLELTLDPVTEYEKVNFPVVYCLDSARLVDDHLKATDTEKFILNAMFQGFGTLNDLGRKTRIKTETLMKNYAEQISISPEAYSQILAQLADYLTDDVVQVK